MGSSTYAQVFYEQVGAAHERALATKLGMPTDLNETCEYCGGLVPLWMPLLKHVTLHCPLVTDDEVARVIEAAARKASEQTESGREIRAKSR